MIKAVSSMFPSKLFNTGGDEININCYMEDESTQEDLSEPCLVWTKDTNNDFWLAESQGITLEEALDTFTQDTHSVLANAGKTPVVWEGHSRQIYPGNHLFTWLF